MMTLAVWHAAYGLLLAAPLYHVTILPTLGSQSGLYSYAYGINDSGQIVGMSDTDNFEEHAFVYAGGTMHDLGTLGGSYSAAYAISNNGTVVGSSSLADESRPRFCFSRWADAGFGDTWRPLQQRFRRQQSWPDRRRSGHGP